MTSEMNTREITVEDFKHAFRHHPAGVAVVTADSGDGPVAMTVSSLSSVALDPPTLVFSASNLSSAASSICEAKTLVVHLLASDQVALAQLGATSGADRFGDEVEWARLPSGEPYYPSATEWLLGRVIKTVEVSGSTLIIVEALQGKPRDQAQEADLRPLVYHNRTWHSLGEYSMFA